MPIQPNPLDPVVAPVPGAGGLQQPAPSNGYASDLLARMGNPTPMAPPAPSATPGAPKNYAADIVSRMGAGSPAAENKFVDASAMRGFSDLYGPSSGKRMASWPKKNSDRYIVTDDDPNKAKILVHRPKPKKTGNNFNDYFVAVPLSSLKNGAFYVDGMPTSPVVKGREKTDGLSAWAASNANSATFGQADKIAGAVNATVEQIANRYSSRSPGAPAPSWGEAYEKFQGRAREQIAQARQDEPGWSAVGDATGFIGPGVVVGGATAKVAAPVVNTIARMGGAPANMLSKVVSGGLQGATAGGLYGYTVGAENEALDRGEASPELFAPERAQSAQTNAVIGSVFGGAMPLLEPFVRPAINVLSNVGSKLLNPIAPGIAEANTRRIATDAARRSLERSGIITVDDFLKRAAKYGDKPVMTGELGQNTLSNLVSLTRQPGTTAEKATAILEGRVAGMPGRLLKDIADETGLNPDDVYASLEDMVKTSRAKAAPLYEEAEAAPFAETANLERIVRDSPILRSLYSKAVNRVQNQAVPLIGQADQMPPLKVYDELKQLVDEEISKRLANGQGISDIEGVRQTLLRELDLISAQAATGVENPSLTQSLYATAREAGGEAPRIEKGLQAGERALQNRGVADDIEREVSKLTGQELSAYQIGVLRNIVKTVESGKLTPSRINSPDFQKRLRSVFGNPAADGIIKKFGIEAKLSQTGARINPNINSVTASALNAGPSKIGDALMQMGQSAARGNIKDTAIGAVSAMVNFLRRQGYSEKQLDAIGDILTSSPDDAAKILFPGKTPRPGSIPPTVPPAGSVRENPRSPQLAPPVAGVPQNPLNVEPPPTPQGPPTNALAPRRPEQAGFGGNPTAGEGYTFKHLDAIKDRLAREQGRLGEAKTAKEREFRAVQVSQAEKELANEIAFLKSKGITPPDEMSIDELAAGLEGFDGASMMRGNPEAIGAGGGAALGMATAPDQNGDGVVDAQERMLGGAGGALTGGIAGRGVRGGMNALAPKPVATSAPTRMGIGGSPPSDGPAIPRQITTSLFAKPIEGANRITRTIDNVEFGKLAQNIVNENPVSLAADLDEATFRRLYEGATEQQLKQVLKSPGGAKRFSLATTEDMRGASRERLIDMIYTRSFDAAEERGALRFSQP
jgi:hypothetical protein